MVRLTCYGLAMRLPLSATLLPHVISRALGHLAGAVSNLFLAPGSIFSLMSLGMAFAVSAVFLLRPRRGKRRLRLRALWRALFPGRIWRHASTRADLGYLLLNTFVTGTLIGWALLSLAFVRGGATALLVHTLGPAPTAFLPPWAAEAVLTLGLFLAYDFAYWCDHYLKHRVSWLWAFHRIHHTAEVLTPVTAFRMHPVDSLIFSNICSLLVGVAYAVIDYGLGSNAHPALLSGTNIVLVLFLCTTIHLQHSHIRLAFTGIWGRIVFSPAHHHIHHSDDPRHYNTNLGSCLTVWDWMFGTLVMPEASQRLRFGAGPAPEGAHSASGGLIHPFTQAAAILMQPLRHLRPRAVRTDTESA